MSSFLITEKQNQEAKLLASKLEDVRQRKRAYLDFTGAMIAVDYLCAKSLRAGIQKSAFKAPKLYLDFEFVDIYCNSHMLYVITTYGTSFAKIPMKHKQNGILPEAYIVIDIKAGMKEAEIKGVIFEEDFSLAANDGKYYSFPIGSLRDIDEILVKVKKYAGIKSSVGRHLDCMNLFIPYIDNKLDEASKKQLICHILSCETCKKRLIEAIEFDSKSKEVENYNLILSKEELRTKENFIKKIESGKQEEEELKGAIDVIYDGGAEFEKLKNHSDFENLKGGSDFEELKDNAFVRYKAENLIDPPFNFKKFVFLTFMVVFTISVIVVLAFSMSSFINKDNEGKDVEGEAYTEEASNTSYQNSSDEYDIIIPKMNKDKGYATVSKVSWEVSSKVTNDEQKKFLQMAGKSIRLNLQNDLLLSSEVAVNNRVKFDIKFMRDGNIESITVSESSGTHAVDEVVRQSVENTLQYMHPPKGAFAGKKDPLTLVVNF